MSITLFLSCLIGYFGGLWLISWLSTRNLTLNLQTILTANRSTPWYIVAFGMIGSSLSGATFVSVPGEVGTKGMSYIQLALGYILGYWAIAGFLLPLYYKLQLPSIYSYLEERYGRFTHKTGALFFLISRLLGASARLYLAAITFYFLLNQALPFAVIVILIMLMIFIYTANGGIQTLVWTDVLQTACMLIALIVTWLAIAYSLDKPLIEVFQNNPHATIFYWDFNKPNYFWKQFLSGICIAIVMTGLDQDMMQKNLTCKTLPEAQKNVFWFSIILFLVNVIFASLGVLLFAYAAHHQILLPEKSDQVYPMLAVNHLPLYLSIFFLLGLIASAFNAADSSLTTLSTSYLIDILGIKDLENPKALQKQRKIYYGIAFAIMLVILGIREFDIIMKNQQIDVSVLSIILSLAGYTYGPLLGLYVFGLFSKRIPHDKISAWICWFSPVICLLLNIYSQAWLNGYIFGFEIVLLNGCITWLVIYLTSRKRA